MDGSGMEPGGAPAALPDLPGLGPAIKIAHEFRDHSGCQPVELILGRCKLSAARRQKV